jgi:hypothetical protein
MGRALFLRALLAGGCHDEPTIVITFAPQDLSGVRRDAGGGGALQRPLVASPDGGAAAAAAAPDGGAPAKGAPAHPAARPEAASAKLALTGADACAKDADCVLVQADCCGCAAGGKLVSVAKSKAKTLSAQVKADCKAHPVACIMAFSGDPSCSGGKPACVDGKCGLKAPAR